MKLPHMPLWVFDIETDEDCRLMVDAEFGRYMRLLIRQWIEGSIPADAATSVRCAMLDPDSIASVQSMLDRKFGMLVDGRRQNPKCAEHRELAFHKVEKNRRNGAVGGRPRNPNETQRLTQIEPNGSIPASGSGSNSSPSADGGVGETKPLPPGFDAWWSEWPRHSRKVGKSQCLKAWKRMGLEAKSELVLICLRRCIASPDWKKQAGEFIPMPMSWLNKTPWETDIAELVNTPHHKTPQARLAQLQRELVQAVAASATTRAARIRAEIAQLEGAAL